MEMYTYRIRGVGRSGVVLWAGGRDDGPDRVVAAADVVPVFGTVRRARVFAGRRGWRLAASETATLELDRLRRWLDEPVRRRVPEGVVLDAWNFFEDLSRGLGKPQGHAPHEPRHEPPHEPRRGPLREPPHEPRHQPQLLPRQGPLHNSAYDKLFDATPRTPWTPEEHDAVRQLLSAGLELWNTCPTARNPR
ncbi:hypothetical protein ABZX85_11265 [Streptomyces sp. NPDC004539]|uniref:hypothetical protein n=1 Tax=Streptomyces sp. NPDC004539 TaxID=3154280 RepID=UPI0033A6E4AF